MKYSSYTASTISASNGTKIAEAPIPSKAMPTRVSSTLLVGKFKTIDGPKQNRPIAAIRKDTWVTYLRLTYLQIQLITGTDTAYAKHISPKKYPISLSDTSISKRWSDRMLSKKNIRTIATTEENTASNTLLFRSILHVVIPFSFTILAMTITFGVVSFTYAGVFVSGELLLISSLFRQ